MLLLESCPWSLVSFFLAIPPRCLITSSCLVRCFALGILTEEAVGRMAGGWCKCTRCCQRLCGLFYTPLSATRAM
jgi:hypothetical protein